MSFDGACAGCGAEVSDETGAVLEMDGDGHRYYCSRCRPGQGWTIADLQAMRAENEVQRELARNVGELRIIEAGGAEILRLFGRK